VSIKALEARIVEAERKYETLRLAALDWGNGIDTHSRLIDKLWQRVEALEAAQQPQDKLDRLIALDADDGDPIVMPSSPAGALLDRVADAIGAADDEGLTNMTWSNHSRAAILEVAAWLDQRGQHGCSLWLRDESNR
jgi:hypothetical protein